MDASAGGAHSSNEKMGSTFYGSLTFITFFIAGMRVLDIRDPYNPKEVRCFIPPIAPTPGCILRS